MPADLPKLRSEEKGRLDTFTANGGFIMSTNRILLSEDRLYERI